jgi:hypothetical protein
MARAALRLPLNYGCEHAESQITGPYMAAEGRNFLTFGNRTRKNRRGSESAKPFRHSGAFAEMTSPSFSKGTCYENSITSFWL